MMLKFLLYVEDFSFNCVNEEVAIQQIEILN